MNEWLNGCLNGAPHSTKRGQFQNIAIGSFLDNHIHLLSSTEIGLFPDRNHAKTPGEAANRPVHEGDACRLLVCPLTLRIRKVPRGIQAAPELQYLCASLLISGNWNWDTSSDNCKCHAGGRRKEYLKLGLSQNSREGGPLSLVWLMSGFCTRYFSVMYPYGASLPPSCPSAPSLSSAPLPHLYHELVSCVLWLSDLGTLKYTVSFKSFVIFPIAHLPKDFPL